MSNSEVAGASAQESMPFRVQAREGARITVLDGYDRVVVGPVDGSVDVELPAGLYTVRSEFSGIVQETCVTHRDSTQLGGVVPAYFTAAPLSGAATSHEYYTEPASSLGKTSTARDIGNATAAPSRLSVFLRAPSLDRYSGGSLTSGLTIRDAEMKLVSKFDEKDAERNEENGWVRFSAAAEAGSYRLVVEQEPRRAIPLHLFRNWQTQIFVMHDGRPRIEAMSMFTVGLHEGFDPGGETLHAIDLGLQGLQHGRAHLPRGILQQLLTGKFENPLLGVIGAYLLLLRPQPDRDQVSVVLGNLEQLIDDGPDVRALRILAADRFGEPPPLEPMIEPPMIRAGLEAVVRAAQQHPELVPEESLIDEIAPELLVDSPWTSWIPPSPRERVVRGARGPGRRSAPAEDWVTIATRDWVEHRGGGRPPKDLTALSSDLGLPQATVRRALRSLYPEARG